MSHVKRALAALIFVSLATAANANEWQALATNNAYVDGPDGRLSVHCETGQNGLREPGISYFIEPKTPIEQSNNGMWGINVYAGDKVLIADGRRAGFENGRWVTFTLADYMLPKLRAGSMLEFTVGKTQKLQFTLRGSSKALDACFAGKAKNPDYRTSRVDIIGLRTGMSFSAFVGALPQRYKGVRPMVRDDTINMFDEAGRSYGRIKYNNLAQLSAQVGRASERLEVNLLPDLMANRVFGISRVVDWDKNRAESEAPLEQVLVNDLIAKYGTPYSQEGASANQKTLKWVINRKSGQGVPIQSVSPACQKLAHISKLDWRSIQSEGSMQRVLDQTGTETPDCGVLLEVVYTTKGKPVVMYMTTEMLDISLKHEAFKNVYAHLQAQAVTNRQRDVNKVQGNRPKL